MKKATRSLYPAHALGLLVTWAVHDTKELRDMRTFQPPVPVPFSRQAAQDHMRRSVTVMGAA